MGQIHLLLQLLWSGKIARLHRGGVHQAAYLAAVAPRHYAFALDIAPEDYVKHQSHHRHH